MKSKLYLFMLSGLLTYFSFFSLNGQSLFVRGDCNDDGKVDLADPIFNLNYLFGDGRSFCMDAHDTNDDNVVNIADPIYNLNYLFNDGSPPPEPFSGNVCGIDPTSDGGEDELGCLRGCDYLNTKKSPWPKFRHDLKNTGRTDFTGPPTPVLAWKYKTNDGIVSSPSIGRDGTIYFGAGWNFEGGLDHNLYALNPDGTLKWSFEGEDGFFSSPAVDEDDTLYISCLDGYLYAVEDWITEGHLKWKLSLNHHFSLSSPAIGRDGMIYVGSPGFEFFSVYPDGEVNWSYSSRWCIISSPAIDDNNLLYIGSKDHYLYIFEPDSPNPVNFFSSGSFYDGHFLDSSPAIGADGTIYIGSDPYGGTGIDPVVTPTNFWAINPDGSLKWSFDTEDGVESSPAIGPDGTIYFGSYDSYLYAITDEGTEGKLKWKFKTGDQIDGSPTVDGDGIIYFGSRDSTLYALYPDGTVKWTFQAEGGFESSPAIDDSGYLYIGSFDGYLYAVGTGGPDVGIQSVDFPEFLEPEIEYIPRAAVRNFRGDPEETEVSCVITDETGTVFSDHKSLEIPGGESVYIDFKSWITKSNLTAEYRITVTTHLADDENLLNNEVTVIREVRR